MDDLTRQTGIEEPLWARIPKGLRISAGVVLALMLLIVVAVALMPSSVWRALIVRSVTQATGRNARIDGPVTVHIFTLSPELIVEGFTLDNADWVRNKPMLSIKRLDVAVSLLPLLRLRVIFPKLIIDTPAVDLERDLSGRANWDFSTSSPRTARHSASPPLHVPVIRQLTVTNGTLTAADQLRKLTFDGHVSVDERANTRDAHALSLRGSGVLNGKPFDLSVDGSALSDVQPTKPYAVDVGVRAADITLRAHTEFPRPFDLAAIQSTFRVTGSDLADVYYLTGLALPDTPPYDISGTLKRQGLLFRIDDLHGKLGSSDIGGELAVDTEPARPKLTARLLSQHLDLADLAAPLGAGAPTSNTLASNRLAPITRARTHTPAAQPASSPASPGSQAETLGAKNVPGPDALTSQPPGLLLPDSDLQVNRVRGMDADVMFDAASLTTPKVPLKQLHFHLRLDDGLLVIDPLAFGLAQGMFSGSVTIDARTPVPQTDIDMKLTNVDLSQFVSGGKGAGTAAGSSVGAGRAAVAGAGAGAGRASDNVSGTDDGDTETATTGAGATASAGTTASAGAPASAGTAAHAGTPASADAPAGVDAAANPPLAGELVGRIRLHGVGTSAHKAAASANGEITLVIPNGEMRDSLAELTGIDLGRGLGLIVTNNQRDTGIRCGVADFQGDDGDFKATTLVFDTTHVLVIGQGQVTMKDEALDLSLRGQPKQVRLLRLRTPITVTGTLLHPRVGVQAGKLAAQVGGAVALGTLLTPVAALLAFVDGGLAKDANCAALLNQAHEETQ